MPRTADHLPLPTDPQPLPALGRAIRTRRHALGISQEHLAGQTGLSRKYMSDVELGKRNLTYYGLYRIAIGLQTTPAVLVQEAHARFAEASPWFAEAVSRGSVDG